MRDLVEIATTDPLEAHCFAACCLQAVLGFALLACSQFAISGGGLFVIIAGFGCRVVGVGRWGR